MVHFSWKTVAFLAAFMALIWACSTSKDTPDPTPGPDPNPSNTGTDRKVLLTNIADNIILPSYANFKTKFDLMLAKSDAFAAKPDQASLTAFRQAWVDAYTEWQKVELFDVGPAESKTLRYFFNIYPANVTGIEENIVAGNASLELPASYPKQGFPALDYLINGLAATDDAILLKYTTAADAAKRLAYVKQIMTQMNTMFTAVQTEWTATYRDKFINATGIDVSGSLSKLVNGYVLNYERYIRSGKFGIPSGAMVNGVPSPEKVEAFYKKDISLILAKTAHQASIDFFNGKDVKTGKEGPGFKTYLTALGAKDSQSGKLLVEVINAQFDASNAKLGTLKPNLYDEVKTNNAAMVAVYTEMQKAVRMLKVDMTSAMSITITYADNDGD
ncbi:imelysin family protein [Larkinella terrae]|uniref:Peptidase M75, Imelysin n=1 Tax=Larkinella terrae TaxID=2025311 RepID=A0A7K0EI93_9BACT|nr:imelysin family protein [Larkinella terrae]MRS61504.1 peptidase M75, Imelysin [Larkinella terrae]